MSWESYRSAIVTLPATSSWTRHELAPRPEGEIEGEFPFAGTVHIVTAYNPGTELDAFTNAGADAALLDYVLRLGLVFFRVVGSDAEHGGRVEPGFGIVGLDRGDALDIGRTFGQDAIYEWRADALEILACAEDDDPAQGERSTHGWSWTRVPEARRR